MKIVKHFPNSVRYFQPFPVQYVIPASSNELFTVLKP